MNLCICRKMCILGAYVRHNEGWEDLHKGTENVALRSIKCKNMKCGVCKVVN